MLLNSRINKDRNIILKIEFRTPHLVLGITIINKRVDELHLSSLLSCHRTHEWGLLRRSPWLGEQESKPRIHAFTEGCSQNREIPSGCLWTRRALRNSSNPRESSARFSMTRLVGRDLLPFRFTIHNAGMTREDRGLVDSRAFHRRKCTSLWRLIETGMVWDGCRVLRGFQGWFCFHMPDMCTSMMADRSVLSRGQRQSIGWRSCSDRRAARHVLSQSAFMDNPSQAAP
jgi:hypothetical protein